MNDTAILFGILLTMIYVSFTISGRMDGVENNL